MSQLALRALAMLFLSMTVWVLLPCPLLAQITTGSLEGTLVNEEKAPIPFANILLIHTQTGTRYGSTSMDNGRYVIDQLKPGGPYSLQISYVGYESIELDSVYIALAKVTRLNIEMRSTTQTLPEVEVKVNKTTPFASSEKGISTNLNEDAIQNAPTLNRSLQDITRLVPQGGQNSFGGSNYRYNNLSIDGASNNDVLGFQEPASGAAGSVASNTPGALAGTQPISLDAIQEVQVALTPFDVQQGNFTGASLNAVTRSGSNRVEGSVYWFGRNQWLTGKSVDTARSPIADYADLQSGFRIGGPIVRNKLFFFANYETTYRNEPVLNAPGDPGTLISADIAQAVHDTLMSRYGYDAGSFGSINNLRVSNKFFVRFDLNLHDHHQLTLRDNYVRAQADNLDRGSSFLKYSSQGFTHHSHNNSLVGELKSRLSNTVYNHLIMGYNVVNDERTYDGEVFPHLEITYNSANTIFAGTYREAAIYGLTLHTRQLTDNLKVYKNKHTFTFGTNNDLYRIEYRFLTAWNGRWEYHTLNDFFADQPSRVRGVYNYSDNTFDFNKANPSADFRVMLLSAYVQDKYSVSDRLSFSLGVRMDMQVHPDKVPLYDDLVNTPAFAHFNNTFGGKPQLNPRAGFQYIPDEKETVQLRGGSGLFTGRIPFAWYAYSHYISGHHYGNIDLRPDSSLPITRDLSTLQQYQPNLTEINLVDNDFKLPRVWRSSLTIDVNLPHEFLFTLEGMYSKSLTDIWFQSINLKDSTAQLVGADNRSYYLGSGSAKKINPRFTNVFLLTNTDLGFQYFLTASVKKSIGDHIETYAAYTYGESKDVMNGVRNSMAANFNWNQAVNSNAPDLSWSNFDVRHRIVGTLGYHKAFGKRHHSRLMLIYTGRSGFPFSYTISGDINNDGSSRNDLFFVPATQDDIQFRAITDDEGNTLVSPAEQWAQLDAYISNDPYLSSRRGQFTQRNGGRAPWNHLLDLRLSHAIQFNEKPTANRLEITLDCINFLNLLYHQWGLQTYVPNVQNSSYQLIDFEGIQNGKALYQFNNPQGSPWQVDPLNSRWQAQLGIRYSF